MTNDTLPTRPYVASIAETRFLDAGGVRYAYRAFGPEGGTPLILLNRFRGSMDDWDPAFLEVLAAERRVIAFDTVGFARSTGEPPTTMVGFAKAATTFIEALGFKNVDVLGFSFGGMVAQQLALDRPDLARRLVLAGSGPGYVENGPTPPAKVWEVAFKPVNVDEDFLYLFFKDTPTSQTAGRDYLARLSLRKDAFEKLVGPEAYKGQLAAGSDVSTAETSFVHRLGGLTQPVLVANGDQDIMIPTYCSYVMAQALPNAKLVIYPDSGHGFLFQYANAFGREVVEFLRH